MWPICRAVSPLRRCLCRAPSTRSCHRQNRRLKLRVEQSDGALNRAYFVQHVSRELTPGRVGPSWCTHLTQQRSCLMDEIRREPGMEASLRATSATS
jgi:hypothetical protein